MALSSNQKSAIEILATEVITVARPSELILIRHLDLDKLEDRSGGMLGFDAGTTANVVLPHLLKFLKFVATAGAGECAKLWGKQMADWIFKDKDSQVVDTKSLRDLAETFKRKLIEQGRDEEDSVRIADALVSTLVSRPALLRKLAGATR